MTHTTLEAEDALNSGGLTTAFAFITTADGVEVVHCSDTRTGICEALLEGYDELPQGYGEHDPHLDMRHVTLANLANTAQAVLLASIEESNPGIVAGLSEDQLTALMSPKDGEILDFDTWDSDVPLLLLATQYAPVTAIPAPEGDTIIWLNAHDERVFIESLERLGFGRLIVNEELLLDTEGF